MKHRLARMILPLALLGLQTARAEEFPDIYTLLGIQPAQLSGLRVWQSTYAGRAQLAGNSADGTQSVTASVVGETTGADYQLDDNTLLGGSVAVGRQTFSAGSGHGRSSDAATTLYGRRVFAKSFYVLASLGYGWHTIDTERVVTLPVPEILDAHYHANDIGGRIEGGYAFTAPVSGLSSYIAFAGDSYHQPAYGETSPSQNSFFAVTYDPKTLQTSHTEAGLRYGSSFSIGNRSSLWLDASLGWQHELDNNPYVLAAFETKPATSFILHSTKPASDTALIGLGGRLSVNNALTLGLRTDNRLGDGTTILSGTADATYRW